MRTSFSETAYAKINLALHVRAREPDGYHRIETLFAFARDGDMLSVEPSDELTLEISGPFASVLQGEQDNLVLRAARALRERFGIADGAVLRLEKMLPVASGIGGGSADAAAALRLLSRLWGITDKVVLEQITRWYLSKLPAGWGQMCPHAYIRCRCVGKGGATCWSSCPRQALKAWLCCLSIREFRYRPVPCFLPGMAATAAG